MVAERSRFVSRLCNTTVASTITAPAESRTVPLMAAVAWAQAGDAESVNTNAAANNVNTTIHRSYVSEKTWRVMVDPPHTRSRSGLCGIVPQLSAVGLYSMDSGPTQLAR